LILMKTTNKSVKEIAFEVGIGDPNYFTKIFKKHYGVTPKNYMDIYN